jgi:hypothetical protein
LMVMSNCPGLHGSAGVAVGVGVGVGATVGVAVATDVAVGVALGVVFDLSEPQAARTLTATTAASGRSHRCIALERTRCGPIMRTSRVPWQVLVGVQHRREEVAVRRDPSSDRGDRPAVGAQIRIVEFLPCDGG